MGSLPPELTCPQCETMIAEDSVVLVRHENYFTYSAAATR